MPAVILLKENNSMGSDPIALTQEGLNKITKELHQLKTVKRKELAGRLEAAKDLGDLSENADYQQAKEDSAWTEGRINELEDLVSRAVLAEAPKAGVVSIGSTATVSINGQTKLFTVVGATEANPSQGRISSESPLGAALLNAKVGNEVEVKTPGGMVTYKVIKVE